MSIAVDVTDTIRIDCRRSSNSIDNNMTKRMLNVITVISHTFNSFLNPPLAAVTTSAYYAIFDGHAGAQASRFSAKRLHLILAEKLLRTGQLVPMHYYYCE